MLTSRAEYRLNLRHDNADMRLSELGQQIGLLNAVRTARWLQKRDEVLLVERLLGEAGFACSATWTDAEARFAVIHAVPAH